MSRVLPDKLYNRQISSEHHRNIDPHLTSYYLLFVDNSKRTKSKLLVKFIRVYRRQQIGYGNSRKQEIVLFCYLIRR